MTEAEAQLRKGLDLLANLPDGNERQEHELTLQIALGTALMATQGFAGPALAQTLSQARRLCEQLDRPSQLASLLSEESHHHLMQAELALACQESKELLDLREARNDPALKFQGCLCSTTSWFHVGNFAAARAYAEQALALYDPAHPRLWPADPQILAITFSFLPLFYPGYLDQARLLRDKALAQARRRTHAFTLAVGARLLCVAPGHHGYQRACDLVGR
jgi:hypothetical protein